MLDTPSFEAVATFLVDPLQKDLHHKGHSFSEGSTGRMNCGAWNLCFWGYALYTKNAVIACDSHEKEAENESS